MAEKPWSLEVEKSWLLVAEKPLDVGGRKTVILYLMVHGITWDMTVCLDI